MTKKRTECKHKWISNNGQGGAPNFMRDNSISKKPLMYAKCSKCDRKMLFNRKSWNIRNEFK